MHRRIFLHVGTPKSGTTSLQEHMHAAQAALLEQGVLFPAAPVDHFHAAVESTYGNFHGHSDEAVVGAWSRLVARAREHGGTTVLSHELFGDLSAEAAACVVRDLDFAEVHVVLTLRDLARQLPAVWQEDVKNRHHLPYEDFLALVRPGAAHDVDRPGPGRPEGHRAAFWLRQDVPSLARRWLGAVPADRLHVVTVPPAGAGGNLLWERFAEVVGIDTTTVPAPAERRNVSMGSAATELLRRLNERLDYSVAWPAYGARITHDLVPATLARRTTDPPLRLPAAERAWVSARADADVAALRALGCRVRGDLEELRVPAVGREDTEGAPLPDALLEVAMDALVALVRSLPDHVAAEPAPAPQPEPGPDPLPAPRDGAEAPPSPRPRLSWARRRRVAAS